MAKDESERYGRYFGDGTVLGDQGDTFFDLPNARKVRILGWSHACPVVPDVINYYSQGKSLEDGTKLAIGRYAECNFIYGVVVETAKRSNEGLYKLLTTSVERKDDEVVGNYIKGFVPKDHDLDMSPLSTLWGYALPRVLLELMGPNRETVSVVKALNLLDAVVEISTTPEELVIRLAEQTEDKKTALSHLFSKGVYLEENCEMMAVKMFELMYYEAPELLKTYQGLTSQEKADLEILSFFGDESIGWMVADFDEESRRR